jgi:type IV pilus assembly protein PilV
MHLNSKPMLRQRQTGSSLIEVLVAILILSFGMLALGGMMSYAVQMPKLAGYRASATTIGAGLVDRMRANTAGFAAGAYQASAATYYGVINASLPERSGCAYPNCSTSNIANQDKFDTVSALRNALPPTGTAGIALSCVGNCTALEGTLYVIWDEPSFISALNNTSSDENCGVTSSNGIPPRCVVIRFKL